MFIDSLFKSTAWRAGIPESAVLFPLRKYRQRTDRSCAPAARDANQIDRAGAYEAMDPSVLPDIYKCAA